MLHSVAVIIHVDRNWETVSDVGMVVMETQNRVRLFSGTAVMMRRSVCSSEDGLERRANKADDGALECVCVCDGG